MKQFLFCIILLLAGISAARAQSAQPADTIPPTTASAESAPDAIDIEALSGVKSYDGFLLDIGLMNLSAPTLPRFTLEVPNASKDYNSLFRLNPNTVYSQGLSNTFLPGSSTVYGMNPFGLTGFWSSPQNLQMGSFTLKNGMRIHTYGEYDKDGWRVPNPSALPWERNNFKGAFELKSANGAFGIRIEVQQGNRTPFY